MAVKAREIELKNIIIDGAPKESINYKQALIIVMEGPDNPQAGVRAKELRENIPIANKIAEVEEGGKLLLTESEWSVVKRKVENHPYPANLPIVLQFIDDICNAPEVELTRA